MQSLSSRHGSPMARRALRFLSIRLRSRPQTRPLADDVDAARKRVEEARDRYEQAVEERVAQTAEIGYLDSVVDARVMDVAREFHVLAGGKLDDPRRPLLFRKAPSVVLEDTASADQGAFVTGVVFALRNEPALAPLKHLADPLEQAQQELEAALKRRTDLGTPEARAAAHLSVAVEDGKRVYNRMYAQLTLLLGGGALVESFFTDLSTKDVGAKESDGAEAGTGPA